MDLPFNILLLYMGFATVIFLVGLVMGIKRITGSPFVCVFAGLMIFASIVMVENVEVDYVEALDYTLSYPMNVTTGTGNLGFSTANLVIAERPASSTSALLNKPITCIQLAMSKGGSPTGDVIFGIFDNDGKTIKQFGTITASTINTSQRNYIVCLPNHDYWTISMYDHIGAKHLTSDAVNFVRIHLDTTANTFDGTNSVRTTYITNTWTDSTTQDLRMVLIHDDVNVKGEPVDYAFNQENVFPFTIVLTVFYIFTGVIIQMQQWKNE